MKNSLAAGGISLLFSQYGIIILTIGFSVYFLRIFSQHQIAVIAVFEILLNIFGFAELGLNSLVIQRVPSLLQTEDRQCEALGLIKCEFYSLSAILCCFGIISAWFALDISSLLLKTTDFAWAIYIFIPGAISSILWSFLKTIAQVRQRFSLIAYWDFLGGLIRLALSAIGYFFYGFPGYLLGLSFSTIIPLVGMGWPLRQFLFNSVRAVSYLTAFRSSWPFFFRTFMRYGFMNLDQAIVGILLSPSVLATYSVARRLSNYINITASSLMTPVSTQMAILREASGEMKGAFFHKATRYISLTMVPLCVVVAVASPWLMSLYGGSKYAQGWPLLALLCLAQAGSLIYSLYSCSVFASMQPGHTLALDSTVGMANYLTAPLLIATLGQYGVVWGQIAGFGAGVWVACYFLRQIPEIHFDWGALKLLTFPLGMTVALVVIAQIIFFRLWVAPIYYLLAAGLFFWLIGKRLNCGDWEIIRSICPPRLHLAMQKVFAPN
jgi:O-antigen/teichoic acid export membrane protein